MAQVISAIQQKGGVGKSTLLCALALLLSRDGTRVVIIDTDRQKTCADFHDLAEPGFDVYSETNEDLLRGVVQALTSTYDVILIDTAGIDSQMVVYVAASSDVVLIPSGASRPDAAGAIRTWKKIQQVQDIANKPAHACIIMMNFNPTARITANVHEAYAAAGAPLYRLGLPTLTGFREMHTTGSLPDGVAARHLAELTEAFIADNLLERYNGKTCTD